MKKIPPAEPVPQIRRQELILLKNIRDLIETLSEDDFSADCRGFPVWKHVYHLLHSHDKWLINPSVYSEPAFHEPSMDSLDRGSDRSLSKRELATYFEEVGRKVLAYVDGLDGSELFLPPEGCSHSRAELIMGQMRHAMYHVGSLHAYMHGKTGKWPAYTGLDTPAGDADVPRVF